VHLDTGGFNCFGCGAKGGDVLAFVMLRDHLSFPAALRHFGIARDSQPSRHQPQPRLSPLRQAIRRLAAVVVDGPTSERGRAREVMNRISAELAGDSDNQILWNSLELEWELRELADAEHCAALEVRHGR
jgi:hypothetical protein